MEVLLAGTLLIPEGLDAHVEFDAPGDESPLNLDLVFEDDDGGADVVFDMHSGSHGTIRFKNWHNTAERNISEPFNFATSDNGSQLYLMCNITPTRSMRKVTYQFMVGFQHA